MSPNAVLIIPMLSALAKDGVVDVKNKKSFSGPRFVQTPDFVRFDPLVDFV